MTKCAELLQNEVPIDFVDINLGCPIDLVFKQVQLTIDFTVIIRFGLEGSLNSVFFLT